MVNNIEIKEDYEKMKNLANELGATIDQVIEIKKYLLILERDKKKHLEKERKKKAELAVLNYSLGIRTNETND